MSLKITIDNEEVLCDKNFKIEEEMLNTSSVILNNVFPATWETDKDYVSNFYYPKDYAKCKIFDETVYPASDGTTVEGTSISADDVDLSYDYNYAFLGDTEQNGTPTPSSPIAVETTTGNQVVSVCGKNLCDGIFRQGNRYTIGLSETTRLFTTQNYFVKSGQAYTISTTLDTSAYKWAVNLSAIKFPITLGTSYYYDSGWRYTNSFTFTPSQDGYLGIIISKSNGSDSLTPDDISSYTWQMELGSTASTYEEYKGNDYEINLGKNLLDIIFTGTTLNDVDYTNNNGTITLNGTATANGLISSHNSSTGILLQAGTYTLSANNSVAESNNTYIRLCTLNGTAISGTTVYLGTANNKATFTLTSDTKVRLQIRIGNGINYDNYVIYPQLEKGSVATSYTPYKTPIELCEIGDYQDRIFYNTEDSPYYDSNLNEAWYLHKEIGKYVYNNDLTNNSITANKVEMLTPALDIVANTRPLTNIAICNMMGSTLSNYTGLDGTTSAKKIRINIATSYVSSYNEFKTLASNNNLTIYYVLATSTDTEITDTDLIDQLDAISLLSGTNNISITSADLPAIMKLKYNYYDSYTTEDMIFCGVVENTGNISLNPRHPHYCNLQVLDFKTFLSEGETLDFVIYEKTIQEAIEQVINAISEYGFVIGNINLLNASDVIGAYSTKDKTAYDVFNYIADITQSRWTTRMIDEYTVAIDFYDPSLMNSGTAIEYTQQWFEDNNIIDMQFNYSSKDYRNKQVMTSNEVYANIETTETIVADGYQTQFNTTDKIGNVSSMTLNGTEVVVKTKEEYDLGYSCDFYYTPGNNYFESANLVSGGAIIVIEYYAIIQGREILLDNTEINRVNTMTGRKGIVARYENRNDATTTTELSQIGQSYLKYKGTPEITLTVESLNNIWNIGDTVSFTTSPLTELATDYMVKKKSINYITTQDNLFYTYELTSSFNSETAINYFDNQRSKANGNIGQGETVSRNVDISNTANVVFYNLEVNEVEISTTSELQAELQSPLGVE